MDTTQETEGKLMEMEGPVQNLKAFSSWLTSAKALLLLGTTCTKSTQRLEVTSLRQLER